MLARSNTFKGKHLVFLTKRNSGLQYMKRNQHIDMREVLKESRFTATLLIALRKTNINA